MSELRAWSHYFRWTLINVRFPKLCSDTDTKVISVYYKNRYKMHFILPFLLWESALNSTRSHCGTRRRGSAPTPPGMKTAPLAGRRRPASARLVHPGSTPRRLWTPRPPGSQSCPPRSRRTHTDWSTPSPWSGKSRLKSRRHSSDSTGSRRAIHKELSAGPAWRTERKRRVLLLKTAKPAEKKRGTRWNMTVL